jgi:hypothetical protein
MQTCEKPIKSNASTPLRQPMPAKQFSTLLRAYRTQRPAALTTPLQTVAVLVALELEDVLVENDVMEVGSANDNGKGVDNDVDIGTLGAVTVM